MSSDLTDLRFVGRAGRDSGARVSLLGDALQFLPRSLREAFNPDQPRAANGRWGDGGGSPSSSSDGPKSFTASEEASGKESQPTANLDELYRQAETNHTEFTGVMRSASDKMGGEFHFQQKGWEEDVAHRPSGTHVAVAPLKGRDRAEEKVTGKYDGDASRLSDVVRGTVTVPTVKDIPEAVDAVRTSLPPGWTITAPEDRFASKVENSSVYTGPTPSGYRDVSMLIRSPSGFKSELQVSTSSMLVAKASSGHALYEQERVITEGADAEGRSMTGVEQSTVDGLRSRQTDLYQRAYKRSF